MSGAKKPTNQPTAELRSMEPTVEAALLAPWDLKVQPRNSDHALSLCRMVSIYTCCPNAGTNTASVTFKGVTLQTIKFMSINFEV